MRSLLAVGAQYANRAGVSRATLPSPAMVRRAQILIEERDYVVLEAIGDGAGMGSVIHLEAIPDAVALQGLVEVLRVEAETVLITS